MAIQETPEEEEEDLDIMPEANYEPSPGIAD